MTFEFYKNRINQDLLDDLKINRIIIERTKQQAKRFDEIRAEEAGLNDFQLDDFNKIYLSFSSTLDDYVNKLEANTEIFRNAGLVIYRYNLLANVLNKLNFNFLPKIEKDKLVNQLEDLEPKLEELYRYANINDFTDLKSIGDIVNNFKKKTFQQVKVGDVRLKEIQPLDEPIENDLDTIINYLSTLTNTEKDVLTKTDISNLEKLSQKAQQTKRDLQRGKAKETDIKQLIKDFDKLYKKIDNKIISSIPPPPPLLPSVAPRKRKQIFKPSTTTDGTEPMADVLTNPEGLRYGDDPYPLDPYNMYRGEEEAPAPEPEPALATAPEDKYKDKDYNKIRNTRKDIVIKDLRMERDGGLKGPKFKATYKITKDQAKEFLGLK
jgi:hypothetical protein